MRLWEPRGNGPPREQEKQPEYQEIMRATRRPWDNETMRTLGRIGYQETRRNGDKTRRPWEPPNDHEIERRWDLRNPLGKGPPRDQEKRREDKETLRATKRPWDRETMRPRVPLGWGCWVLGFDTFLRYQISITNTYVTEQSNNFRYLNTWRSS